MIWLPCQQDLPGMETIQETIEIIKGNGAGDRPRCQLPGWDERLDSRAVLKTALTRCGV